MHKITIDEDRGIIYGANGSAAYFINESGGLDLTDTVGDGLSDEELDSAISELMEDLFRCDLCRFFFGRDNELHDLGDGRDLCSGCFDIERGIEIEREDTE